MPLSPPQYIGNLDDTNPRGTDSRTIADDSIRNLKTGLKQSFPNVTAACTATHTDLNLLAGLAAGGLTKAMAGVGGTTVIYMYNLTAPTGWTIEPTITSVRALTVSNASGGTLGGTQDIENLSDSFTINITLTGNTGDETAKHRHVVDGSTDSSTGGSPIAGGAGTTGAGVGHFHEMLFQTGEDLQSHQHTVAGVSGAGANTIGYTPRYARGILVILDA